MNIIICITAFNAHGEVIRLNGHGPEANDLPDTVYVTSAGDALAFMGRTRSGFAYDERTDSHKRNRVASFRLSYSTGGEELCERSPALDSYRRRVLAEHGCTVFTNYTDAHAARGI